jgi:elongation factor G
MFVDPIISIPLELAQKADAEKLADSLSSLAERDLTLVVRVSKESGQTIIAGMSELQLVKIVHRLIHEFTLDVRAGAMQVEQRETITDKAPSDGKFIRQSCGRGQYGHVTLLLEPTARGAGFQFENRIFGGVVPKQYIPAVETGVRNALPGGVIAGCPIVDVKVSLLFGSYHEVDSSDMAFRIAGSMAFKEGFLKANPVVLEPIMKIKVEVPAESLSDVFDDIRMRRGKIVDLEESIPRLRATVPLSELVGYAAYIHDKTDGKGQVVMRFIGFEEMSS